MLEFTNVGVAVLRRWFCKSFGTSMHLQSLLIWVNRMVEAILFSPGSKRKGRQKSVPCNLKKEKKIEFHWDSLLFTLFYSRCLLVCLTNVSLPQEYENIWYSPSHNLPGYFYNLSSADTYRLGRIFLPLLWLLEVWNYIFVFEVRHTVKRCYGDRSG